METIKILIPYMIEPVDVVIFLNGQIHELHADSNVQLWDLLIKELKREVIRVQGLRFHVTGPDDV